MSERHDRDLPGGSDEVSAAYRAAGFTDSPPPHVDARILAAAKRRAPQRARQFGPPLALAATVVLALGIVLRLALPGGGAESPGATGLPSVPAGDDFATPALLQESTDGAASESPAEPAAAARSLQPAEAIADGDTAACTPTQRGTPEDWLACISLQLDRASVDLASAEFLEFTRAYPDFPVPAEIAARIEP